MARQLFVSSLDPGRGNFHYYHLPKGLLTITLKQLDADGALQLTAEKTIVPDPDHRYYLQYTNTGRSNDKVDISFNEEGYLAAVNIETEDVTLQVIENVIQSVKDMVTPTPRSLDPTTFPVDLLKETIDPFDQSEIDRIAKEIKSLDPEFVLSFKGMAKKKQKGMGTGDQYGILCKPMELCELRYTLKGHAHQELIQMPHPDVTHLISVPNAPFVKSTLNITFGQYGYPTNIKIDQPSWWLAASQMPGKIIKGIFALPSQLIQLRVNYMNDQTAAKQELEEAKQSLQAHKDALAAAQAAAAENAGEGENNENA
jgi:hypothetical protein